MRVILPLLLCRALLPPDWPRHSLGSEGLPLLGLPVMYFAVARGSRVRWPFVLGGLALAFAYAAGDCVEAMGKNPRPAESWTVVVTNLARLVWLLLACPFAVAARWRLEDEVSWCASGPAAPSTLWSGLLGTTLTRAMQVLGVLFVLSAFSPSLWPPRLIHRIFYVLPALLVPLLVFLTAGPARVGALYLGVGAIVGFCYALGDIGNLNRTWWNRETMDVFLAMTGRTLGLMLACRLAASARWWIQDYWPWRPHPRDICHRCGYNLTGNVSGRCPECGTDLPVTE